MMASNHSLSARCGGREGAGAAAIRIFAARNCQLFADRPFLCELVGTNRAKLPLALFAAFGKKRFSGPGSGRLLRDRADVAERCAFSAATLEGFLDAA